MFKFCSDVHLFRIICIFIILESMFISNTCYCYNPVKINMFKPKRARKRLHNLFVFNLVPVNLIDI